MTSVCNTARSVTSIAELLSLDQSTIRWGRIMQADSRLERPDRAGSITPYILQHTTGANRRSRPSKIFLQRPQCLGLFPSPIDLLTYNRVDIGNHEDGDFDIEMRSQFVAYRRRFLFFPSRLFRLIGGKITEITLTTNPSFDRIKLDVVTKRELTFGMMELLGFGLDLFKPRFLKRDLGLWERSLDKGEISANDILPRSFRYHSERRETSLLEVSISIACHDITF